MPHNPAKIKVPWWLGSFIIGGLAPALRNVLLKKYIVSNASGEEYAGAFFAGVGNGIVGGIALDGLFPGAFWVRMASPIVLQPAFKLFKVDPAYASRDWFI